MSLYAALRLRGFLPNMLSQDATTLERIWAALRQHPEAHIRMACFNEAEATILKKHLTQTELSRVSFSWGTF